MSKIGCCVNVFQWKRLALVLADWLGYSFSCFDTSISEIMAHSVLNYGKMWNLEKSMAKIFFFVHRMTQKGPEEQGGKIKKRFLELFVQLSTHTTFVTALFFNFWSTALLSNHKFVKFGKSLLPHKYNITFSSFNIRNSVQNYS